LARPLVYLNALCTGKGDAISLLLFVEIVDLLSKSLEGVFSLSLFVLELGLGGSAPEVVLVLRQLSLFSLTLGTSEDIGVLLLLEVDVIVSVRMWELGGIITIILPGGIGSHVLCTTIGPVSDCEIGHGLAFVVVSDDHGSLVGLIVDCLSSKHPLSLLSKTLKNVIRAHFHDRDLLIETGFLTLLSSASLIFLDFSVATTGNLS